jgi:hypothetical protein
VTPEQTTAWLIGCYNTRATELALARREGVDAWIVKKLDGELNELKADLISRGVYFDKGA